MRMGKMVWKLLQWRVDWVEDLRTLTDLYFMTQKTFNKSFCSRVLPPPQLLSLFGSYLLTISVYLLFSTGNVDNSNHLIL